jgi:hypothetical protein
MKERKKEESEEDRKSMGIELVDSILYAEYFRVEVAHLSRRIHALQTVSIQCLKY